MNHLFTHKLVILLDFLQIKCVKLLLRIIFTIPWSVGMKKKKTFYFHFINPMLMANPYHPLYEVDEILPRQEHRYKERIYFDLENAFLLKRDVFDNLLERDQDHLEHPTKRSFCLRSRHQMLLVLYWLGCGALQLHVTADAHGISKATMCRTLRKVNKFM